MESRHCEPAEGKPTMGKPLRQYDMVFKLSTVNLAEQLFLMIASKLETPNANGPLLPLHGTIRVSARHPPLVRAFSAFKAQYKRRFRSCLIVCRRRRDSGSTEMRKAVDGLSQVTLQDGQRH